MDSVKIISFLSGSEVPTENELKELFAIRREFPYFQVVCFLCAKYDYTSKNISKAALASSERAGLQKRLDRGYHFGTAEQDAAPVAIRPNETGLNAFDKLSAEPAASTLKPKGPKVKGLDEDDELLVFDPKNAIETSEPYLPTAAADTVSMTEAAAGQTAQAEAQAADAQAEIMEEAALKAADNETVWEDMYAATDIFTEEAENATAETSVADENDELRRQLQETLSQLRSSVQSTTAEIDDKYIVGDSSGDLADSYGERAKENQTTNNADGQSDKYETLNDLDALLQNTSETDLKTSDFFKSIDFGNENKGAGNFFDEFESIGKEKKSGSGNFFDDFDDPLSKKDAKKTGQDGIIDKFIEEKPSIKFEKPKSASYDDESDPDVEDLAVPSTTPNFKKVTESFAKIYEGQGDYAKAIEIYEQLSLELPNKKPYFADCIKKLKNKI